MAAGAAESHRQVINARLQELQVQTAPDEVDELADAYPALLSWMRLAEKLGRDGDYPDSAPVETPAT